MLGLLGMAYTSRHCPGMHHELSKHSVPSGPRYGGGFRAIVFSGLRVDGFKGLGLGFN